MKSLDLFSSAGEFQLPDLEVVISVPPLGTLLETNLFTDQPVSKPEPETVSVPAESYSERSWMLQQAKGLSGAILLHRLNKHKILLEPMDPLAVAITQLWRVQPAPTGMLWSKPQETRNKNSTRVHWNTEGFLSSTSSDSTPGEGFLRQWGLEPILAPSLQQWLVKERKRRQVETASFLLPEIHDTRPILEQLEIGLVLQCQQPPPDSGLTKDQRFIVSTVPNASDDAKEEDLQVELVTLSGSKAGSFSLMMDWDAYFVPDHSTQVVYDPEQCVESQYPGRIQQLQQELAKLKAPLFLHTQKDVVQSAVKSRVLNGKLMRMGKTREALVWAQLRQAKKVAFITPKNVREVVAKEMQALGRSGDYKKIQKFRDLNNSKWLDIHTYDWLKRVQDPFRSAGNKGSFYPHSIKVCPCCQKKLDQAAKAEGKETSALAPKLIRMSKIESGFWNHPVTGKKEKKYTVSKTEEWGYRCPNKDCGYVDYDRAKYMEWHIEDSSRYYCHKPVSHGRMIQDSQIAHSSWVPPRYRRVKKRYDAVIVDEIHMIKSATTLQSVAVAGLKARNRYGMTGTLMPNGPTDPYWPLHWIFEGKQHMFPYERKSGLSAFASKFTENVKVTNYATGAVYTKRIPYLKSPYAFWNLMKPLMIRRNYDDPLVIESFAQAGLKIPSVQKTVYQVEPEVQQAIFLAASLSQFEELFNSYVKEIQLKNKTAVQEYQDKQYQLNSSYVLGQMLRMRIAATCPGWLNEKYDSKIYNGHPGGAKLPEVYNLVAERVSQGEKILILSDFRYNQKLLADELAEFHPIRFDTGWSETKRAEAFDLFQDNAKYSVFIAGPRAIGLGVDLSAARTVICTDLLWTPGLQHQAYSRILKPVPEERVCEIIILQTKYSIDKHIYDTFYAKQSAAEQALDRRVLGTKDKVIDIKAFVDLVLADKGAMLEWLADNGEDELCYVPVLGMIAPAEERQV